MANNEQVAPLARATLIAGMTIAFEAISPTDGSMVGGVVIDVAAIYGDDGIPEPATVGGAAPTTDQTAPLWAPVPNV